MGIHREEQFQLRRVCSGGDLIISLFRGYNGAELVKVEKAPPRGKETRRTLLEATHYKNFTGQVAFAALCSTKLDLRTPRSR
jgi:hypothetical protein